MTSNFGQTKLVFDRDNLDQFNEKRKCVCGNDLSDKKPLEERFGNITAVRTIWCESCKRKYYFSELFEEAVPPAFALATEAETGLHKVSRDDKNKSYDLFYAALSVLSFMPKLNQYLDLFPFNYDAVWAYVNQENIVVSVLIENDSGIQVIGTAPGFQREGYGTQIVEKWAQEKGLDIIEVHGWFDRVEVFYKQLSIPVEDVTD